MSHDETETEEANRIRRLSHYFDTTYPKHNLKG